MKKGKFPEAQAMALYKKGLYDRQIGDAIGYKESTVTAWRIKNNLLSQTQRKLYGKRENVTNSLEQDVAEQRRLGYSSYGKYMADKMEGSLCNQKAGGDK